MKATVRRVIDVVPDDLRRAMATRLFVVDGWNPAEVQAFVGHRDPRVAFAIDALIDAKMRPEP